MGVPSFYAWLIRKFSDSFWTAMDEHGNCPQRIDNLYLDMNGIIHPCSHPTEGKQPETEEEMINNVMTYIDRIVMMAKPQNLLFMAIDGVAPRAKMNQQRARRFVGAMERVNSTEAYNSEKERIESLFHIALDPKKASWDSNVITPGTPFMKTLSDELTKYVIRKQQESTEWKNFRVIISDASVPGEGEHKLLQYIREQKKSPKYDPGLVHCIHGMDADLVMLGLLTHESKFFLLREDPFNTKEYNQKPQHLVDLSEVRNCLDDFTEDIKQNIPKIYDLTRIVDDFIFLFFLVGNDFLPNLPALDIEESALDILIDIYKVNISALGGYITDGKVIHLRRLMEVFKLLAVVEDDILFNRYKVEKRVSKPKGDTQVGKPIKLFETETKWAKESGNVAVYFKRCVERKASIPELVQEGLPSFIDRKDPDWKIKYYAWKLNESETDVVKTIPKVVESYIEGMLFVWGYYTVGIPSWSYYYPFHYAPFSSDIYDRRDRILKKFEKFKFTLDKPFKPFDQLLSVLPRASSHALPEAYAREMNDKNSKIAHNYPDSFDRDLNGKSKDFKAVVLLPFIDDKELLKVTHELEKTLNEEETKRNSYGTEILIYNVNSTKNAAFNKAYEGVLKNGHSITVTGEFSGKLSKFQDCPFELGKKIKFGEKTFKNESNILAYAYPVKYAVKPKEIGEKRKNEEESDQPKKKSHGDDDDDDTFTPISVENVSEKMNSVRSLAKSSGRGQRRGGGRGGHR
jgi:5'-3' exoribonuclease 2